MIYLKKSSNNFITSFSISEKECFKIFFFGITSKAIGKLTIFTSIESWGEQANYARYGLDFDIYRQRIEEIANINDLPPQAIQASTENNVTATVNSNSENVLSTSKFNLVDLNWLAISSMTIPEVKSLTISSFSFSVSLLANIKPLTYFYIVLANW